MGFATGAYRYHAQRSILDTYHNVKTEYLQLYLNVFYYYKFNRWYFGFELFERFELVPIRLISNMEFTD